MSNSQKSVRGQSPSPSKTIYLGLFLITLATLLLELGLTRIFSVIMFYHMAFFAISVTLFGMAFGAVIVHFFPRVFTPDSVGRWMSSMAMGFAATIVLSLVVMLGISFDVTRNRILISQLFAVSVVLALPFICSGVAVALALTRFPRRTNLLYGFDLAGAAFGCLLFAPMITHFGAPRFILSIGLIVALAGLIMAIQARRQVRGALRLSCASLLTLVMLLLATVGSQHDWFQIRHVRGALFTSEHLAFDAWNSISRITVHGEDIGHAEGIAPSMYDKGLTDQRVLLIDAYAATPILKFNPQHGFDQFFFPYHDVSYVVHAIRSDAKVAVIGVGGGRDIVAAKAWDQPEIVGIEINNRVLEALTEHFHEYAGRPLNWEGVTLVQDEARSYLTRSQEKFDIIQASLIDTFAATAAGAFVLTENALYTQEGWHVFLDHLTDQGILTMTRWYTESNPVESVRLLALARAVLEDRGITDPLAHLMMVRTPQPVNPQAQPMATILVKKTPFTPQEIDRFDQWVADNELIPLLTPRIIHDPVLAPVLEAPQLATFVAQFPFDVSPPTDDRPFFFDVLRWRDIFKKEFRQGSNYIFSINLKPLIMLGTLLATVCLMAFLFIVVPLAIQGRRRELEDRPPRARRLGMLIYFTMLGLAYIIVELALMQKLTIFLGHPSYSLTVVLFTMLLASGLGSMAAPWVSGLRDTNDIRQWRLGSRRLARTNFILFLILLVTLVAADWVSEAFISAATPSRIILAGLTIAPAAFFMGMPFPLAIRVAANWNDAPLAWFWGINGAFSVCASVVTVALAHTIGLTGTFLAGATCYLVASIAALAFSPIQAEDQMVPAESEGLLCNQRESTVRARLEHPALTGKSSPPRSPRPARIPRLR